MENEKKVALVIPSYEKYPEARADLINLLDSIIMGGTADHAHIMVCLDACSLVFQEEFVDKYPQVIFVNHDGNSLNYCGNSNIGLRITHQKLNMGAILCNQDMILPSWEKLKGLMESPFDGLVSAQSIPPEKDNVKDEQERLDRGSGAQYINLMDTGNKFFPGYLYYYPKAVMDKIGYLTQQLEASYDDGDVIARALLGGFTCGVSEVKCCHTGSHINQMEKGSSRSGAYSPTDGSLGLHRTKFTAMWGIAPDLPDDQHINWILQNKTWTEDMKCP